MSDYNQAGIFSTDDPQSDQMQIDAEKYDPDEYDDDNDDEYRHQRDPLASHYQEEVEISIEVVGCCLENPDWYDHNVILKSQLETWKLNMQEKHRQFCPCKREDNFRFESIDW